MEDGNVSSHSPCLLGAPRKLSCKSLHQRGRSREEIWKKVPVKCKRNLLIYTSINDKIDGNCEARLMGLNRFDNYIKGGLLWLTL